MLRGTPREALAECLGTFVLIVFGVGVVAQVVLGGGASGQYLSINIGWGLAVTMGVYVAAGVSGAHLNPAVTLALALRRGFAWSKVLPYMAAQCVGAFLASAVVYVTYREALDHFDGGVRQVTGASATAGIFATYPQQFVHPFLDLGLDQIVGTALLIALIFALTDQKNLAPDGKLVPVMFGLAVILIGATFGYNAGYAINPARDLGPRIAHAILPIPGKGPSDWGYAWIPVVGPLIGGILGALAFDLFFPG